jgi:signal transduction histidine kinase
MKLSSFDLQEENLKKLLFEDNNTKFIVGFISPHIDFETISKKIKSFYKDIDIVLTSSAGELCNIFPNKKANIYLDTPQEWDSIVLQSFSNKVIKNVKTFAIPLKNEDIVSKNITKSTSQRVAEIENEINKLEISDTIDYKKHLVLSFIDGVSNSENFFMEAMYKSGKFPCNIIGGSAGGKFDFQETFLFDGKDVLHHHATISLIEINDDMRFGIFKSQNFKKSKHSLTVVDADPDLRVVRSIKRKDSDKTENIVDYFCDIFKCRPEKLENKFTHLTLGLEIYNESYIRSVASVDVENKQIFFYIDVDFGDELFLYTMTNFTKQTDKDFQRFIEEKGGQKPVAGLLNDCILRRVNNSKNLSKLKTFDEIPLIGLSTFGEFLGVNINQTLTALFFFEKDEKYDFRDKFIDNFIIQYSNYQSFFRDRELKQLKANELKKSYNTLKELNQELKKKYDELENSKERLVESEKMASLGGMVAGVAHEINTPVGMALTGTSHLNDEIKELLKQYEEKELSENSFKEFINGSQTLCKSIENNLVKAANLVKSFKQVAVDQSSNENRKFNLKDYIDEILLSIHNETKKRKHKIIVDIDDNIILNSNPGAFSQIVTNFIMNSFIHAFGDDEIGEIKISAIVKDNHLHFIYEDNGKGLDEKQKAKIYDPFFTTNRANGGSGLGMNIVYNLVTAKLSGKIKIESEIGHGVRFLIDIPMVEEID